MSRINNWGFQSRAKAETLSRLADREGTRQRRGQRIHYGHPQVEISQIVQIWPSSGSPTVGDLVAPNAYGYHVGRLRFYHLASASSVGRSCWIRLGDWEDNDGGQVVGEQGRYFVGVPIGNITSEGIQRPAYYVTMSDMSFIGKPDSTITKGATPGTVSLYHRHPLVDSTLDLTVYADGATLTAGKYCTVCRVRGGIIYGFPWEC